MLQYLCEVLDGAHSTFVEFDYVSNSASELLRSPSAYCRPCAWRSRTLRGVAWTFGEMPTLPHCVVCLCALCSDEA